MTAKRLGIIGGIAPESTIDYYRRLVTLYRARTDAKAGYPRIVINSIDLEHMLGFINNGRLEQLADFLLEELGRLARAGAELGLLGSNTPHIIFDELRTRAPFPLISIVESTADVAKRRGLKRLGLLGTRITMSGTFYPDVFARAGIEIVPPRADEQAWANAKYLGELVNGIFRDETRAGFESIISDMKARDGIDGMILGGTELPLLLRDESHAGIPLLDTTQIHVERAIDAMLA
jgi:aspartate racemase